MYSPPLSLLMLMLQHVEVHFISAVCENMVSAEAMRPGDIFTASNGKTIEVGTARTVSAAYCGLVVS